MYKVSHSALYFGLIIYTAIGAKVSQDLCKSNEKTRYLEVWFFGRQKLERYNNGLFSDLPNSWASVWDWQIRNSPGSKLCSYFESNFFCFQALLVTKRELFLQAVTNSTESGLYRWPTHDWWIYWKEHLSQAYILNIYLLKLLAGLFMKHRNSTEYINMVDGFLSEYEEVCSIPIQCQRKRCSLGVSCQQKGRAQSQSSNIRCAVRLWVLGWTWSPKTSLSTGTTSSPASSHLPSSQP